MDLVVRPAGRHALLVDVPEPTAVPGWAALLRAAVTAPGQPPAEVVPGAATVLITTAGDLDDLRRLVEGLPPPSAAVAVEPPTEVVIPVRYDGPDLDEVGRLTGLSRDEVVRAHTGRSWRAAFAGFRPGFCYLDDGDPRLAVPRRAEPRTRVPAGAVALAGTWSAVYPSASPGGWQLLGRTDVALWDPAAAEPALVRPGMRVRFVEADREVAVVERAAPAPATPAATTGPALVVLTPGPLSLVQDAGRPGLADVGVGRSGAADRTSFRAANALVGNPPDAAVIETTFGGLTAQARGDLVVAVTGAPAALTLDGEPAPHATALELPDGASLRMRTPATGLRSYLAVRGGIAVPPVLGSVSTDLLSGLGPAPLRRGDVLPVGPASHPGPTPAGVSDTVTTGVLELAVTPGPRADWCTEVGALAAGEWVVTPESNRVGLRLDRPDDGDTGLLQRRDDRELPSEGMVLGAVQLPPGGRPVLFLADHPVTGGYPVIAVVEPADVDRAAQARPGQRMRFRLVDDGTADA